MSDDLKITGPSRRRFVRNTGVAMLAFAVLFLVGTAFVSVPHGILGIVLTAVIVAPLFWWGYEYQLYVRALDEFQSLLSLQAITISAGAALLIGALWGVAEVFLSAPHLNAALLLPVAVVIHSLAFAYLARQYR